MKKLAVVCGDRVKELLIEKGFSKYQLIRESGLNETTIDDLCRGLLGDLKITTIIKICDAFGISMHYFFDSSLFDVDNIDIDV